jgi:excisionase family DNA binding protein
VVFRALHQDPFVADEGAAPAMQELRHLLSSGGAQPLRIVTAGGRSLEVPAPVDRALRSVVDALAAGEAVTVVPLHQQLTTTQAARLLEVSRPTLIGLLERGEIPFSLTGTHRRVRLADALAYRTRRLARATAHLDAILAEAQETGGYF